MQVPSYRQFLGDVPSTKCDMHGVETPDVGHGIANTLLPAVTCKAVSQRRYVHRRWSRICDVRRRYALTVTVYLVLRSFLGAILAHLSERFLSAIDLNPLKKVLASKM